MAGTRLTTTAREVAAKAAADNLFDPKIKKLQLEIRDIVEPSLAASKSHAMQVAAYLGEYFDYKDCIEYALMNSGGFREESLTIKLTKPYPKSNNDSAFYHRIFVDPKKEEEGASSVVPKMVRKLRKLKASKKEAQTKIKLALEAFSTYKQVEAEMPEVYPYLPDSTRPPQLPVTMKHIEDVRALFTAKDD